jgi:hypothetical protein
MLMRRLVFALGLGVLATRVLAAPYGVAGCGLGSLIFEPDSCQISAATTNNSFYTQPFAITFGTSNCVGGGSKSLVDQMQRQFMADNYASLSKEIAQGEGESLRALTQMLGCREASFPQVATTLQSSYGEIFAAPGSGAALISIRQSLSSNPALSHQCHDLMRS